MNAPENWAEWAGVLGCLLAAVHLLWSMLSWKLDRADVVTATQECCIDGEHLGGTIKVTVCNHGPRDVFIKSVVLHVPKNERLDARTTKINSDYGCHPRANVNPDLPIRHGDDRAYYLVSQVAPMVRRPVEDGVLGIYVIVNSPKGELCRIDGPDLLNTLGSIGMKM